MTGKRNIIFGFAYLLMTMALSLFLSDKASAAATSSLLTSAFLQSNIDAVLNIAAGFLFIRLPFMPWVASGLSALLIAGALLHSGILYLAAFGVAVSAAGLMFVGLFLIAAVLVFTGIGMLSLRMNKING